MIRPAAVLWDMDGTLVDTEPYWIDAEYTIVERYGNGRWNDGHARALVGFDLRDAARYLRRHGDIDMAVDDIVNLMLDEVIAKVRVKIPWRPGAPELLAELNDAGIPCAMVTMSWRRLARAVARQLPPGSFHAVISGDDVRAGKPDPEPYREAARRLGVDPTDCIALEDSPTGLRSAVAAGCKTIAIPNVVDIPKSADYTRLPSLTAVDVPYLRSKFAPSRPTPKRRPALLAGALVAIAAIVAGVFLLRNPEPPPPDPSIQVHAWAPYWAIDRSVPSLQNNGASLGHVSPFWFEINESSGPNVVATNQYAKPEATTEFLAAARAAGVTIIPSILDQLPKGQMAAVLADPQRRRQHIDALLTFADQQQAAGLDIDYEQFAFADGRGTWAATRPNWVAFITELGQRLHDSGRTLTVSVPPIYDDQQTLDSGYWVYDYASIEAHVDQIRIMAYDYSTSDPGPVSPLSYVERSLKGATRAVKDRRKLILGLPVYGLNWLVSTTGTCPADAPKGRTTIAQSNIDELVATRQARPTWNPTTGETNYTYDVEFSDAAATCTQHRRISMVTPDGTRQRMDLAREYRVGGVAIWALGFDSPATWTAIGPTVKPPDRLTAKQP